MNRSATKLAPTAAAIGLDSHRPLQGLTPAMQVFVSHVMSGMSYIDAYLAAGYAEAATRIATGQKARELANTPIVSAKLRELTARRDDATTLAPLLTREWVVQGIMSIAQAGEKESTKLAALIALAKMPSVGLFKDNATATEAQRSIEDIDAELRAALKNLKPVIDGDARRVGTTVQDEGVRPGDRRRKPRG